MKRFIRLVTIGALALVAGCSSTKVFHSAFDDITQDTRSTIGDFSTYRQLITLNGLMPMHVPGMLFYEPTSAVPSWAPRFLQAESPALLVGISPKRSMVVEARYDATDPEQAVAAAQKAYQGVRGMAVNAVAARLRQAMLDALSQAKDEEQARALARHLNFKGDKPTPAEIASHRQLAFGEAEAARKRLLEAQEQFSSSLGHNIMVARWTKKEEFQGVAKVFDLVGLGTGRQFEESGVLILAGIRVVSTFFGEDFACMARHASQNPGQWDQIKRAGVTVNMIQARAVGYVSDLDVANTLALSLDVSKEQLSQLIKDGLLESAGLGSKVRAEALVASAMGVSNFGRMVKPVIGQRKTRFYPAVRQDEELEEELTGKHEQYVTVSVTRAQFDREMLERMAAAATDAMCNEELEPKRSLTETVARARRRIEMSAAEAANVMVAWPDNPGHHAEIRDGLLSTLQGTREALARCSQRITQLDADVAAAQGEAMRAGPDRREAASYAVRIASLRREQAAAPLVAALRDIDKGIYGVRQKLRDAGQTLDEMRDQRKEVDQIAAALGTIASDLKVVPTMRLEAACAVL